MTGGKGLRLCMTCMVYSCHEKNHTLTDKSVHWDFDFISKWNKNMKNKGCDRFKLAFWLSAIVYIMCIVSENKQN